MSNQEIVSFFNMLDNDIDKSAEFELLVSDNVTLSAIKKYIRDAGYAVSYSDYIQYINSLKNYSNK